MTLAQMRTELKARGYDHESDSRLTQFLCDGYHELCEAYEWSWLKTTTSGTAPLSIADVREVIAVIDTTQDVALSPADIRDLVEQDGSFSTSFAPTTTGSPVNYWLDDTTLRVYPANTTNTIAVRYVKVPADLSADGDTPIIPGRYHSNIVDIAEALFSARDESDPADQQTVRQEVDRVVMRMLNVTTDRYLDGSVTTVVYDTEEA
jgi:hypothetical protein